VFSYYSEREGGTAAVSEECRIVRSVRACRIVKSVRACRIVRGVRACGAYKSM